MRIQAVASLWLSACFIVGSTAVDAASAGPAFQVRAPRPDVTARTLEWLQTGTDQPGTGKVWVYLTDKNIFDSETCQMRLSEVRSRLDAHAAARRAKVLGDDLVDFLDIPVHGAYVDRISALGGEVVRESRWLNAVSVRAPLDVVREIAALPFVHRIEPVRGLGSPRVTWSEAPPVAPVQRSLLDLFDYGTSRAQLDEINVIEVHNRGYSGAGVIVAMLDTGFEHTHPAFAQIITDGRLLAQYDFINDDGETMNEPGDDPNQHNHGTYTWSTLGGFYEGEVIGPAFGASFILAKTEDLVSETPVEEDNWVAAAEWVDTLGADVISSSLGYLDWYTYPDMDGNTAVTTIGADIAVSRGIVVCNSAGNEGNSPWYYMIAPADGDSVIAVGAVDEFNVLAGFSSHGPTYDGRIKPEVTARGVDTYCAVPVEMGVSFWWLSGTSLSCPLVGGSTALLLEAHPLWSPVLLRSVLMETADNADTPDNDRGWGRIDVLAALDAVVGVEGAPSASARPGILATPNPFRSRTRIDYRLPSGVREPARITVVDVTGRERRSLAVAPDAARVEWDGHDATGRQVAPGVYFVRLTAGEWQATTKLVITE